MTDFIFFNDSGNVNVKFRTDRIPGANNNNVTVMQVTGLDESDITNNNKEKMLALAYDKLPAQVGDFVAFATAHKLNLTAIDNDGTTTALVASNGSTSS